MSILIKYDQQSGKKKLKPWAKLAIGIVVFGGITVGVNHYAGNPLGLESRVSSSGEVSVDFLLQSMMKQNNMTRPQATKAFLSHYYPNESDSNLERAVNGLYSKRAEDRFSMYWVSVNVNGKEVPYPIVFKPGVVDNTHTEQKEVILGKEYAIEGAKAITGLSEKAQSQQSGANPTQSLQRALRF